MTPLTDTQTKAVRWMLQPPCADVILLRLRSAYAQGHATVFPMTLDGIRWVKSRLPDPDPGHLPRVAACKMDALTEVMRQDGLTVEVRG